MRKLFIYLFIFLLTMGMISGCSFWRWGERKEVKPGSKKIMDINLEDEAGGQVLIEKIQAILKTNFGDIRVNFFHLEAPKTIMNFANLARADFYNGTKFHRVIAGFMIQAGDPNSRDDDKSDDGQGGPGFTYEDEINPKTLAGLDENDIKKLEAEGFVYNYNIPSSHNLRRGVIAMANSGPNTNGSQFFIMTGEEAPWLDGRHTVFGEVISGMEVVDKIEKVEVDESNYPLEEVVLEEVVILINEGVDEYDAGDAGDVGDAGDAGDVESVLAPDGASVDKKLDDDEGGDEIDDGETTFGSE